MRILVTNDDGVAAPGLGVAEAIARDVAGPDGEIWVAAPAFEQSGVSHAISFTSPVKMERLEERRLAIGGTPADCVIVALHTVLRDAPPDLVLSGVNRGHNIAEDAVYSGTVGGAIEGALQGVKAIALSQYFRRGADGAPTSDAEMFDAAATHGAAVVRALLATEWPRDLYYNVNFPPVAAGDVRGARYARQGRRSAGAFTPDERVSPGGRVYYWLQHKTDNRSGAPEDDCLLCADGWITATPMLPNYTAERALAALGSETITLNSR